MLAIVVVFLFCLLYTAAIAAQTKGAKQEVKTADFRVATETGEARSLVQSLGFGQRIDVKLTNGSKASGRITGLAADRFVVTDAHGTPRVIDYTQVARITKQKEKLGLFHKPWVGIMFTAAGVGTVIVLALQFFD